MGKLNLLSYLFKRERKTVTPGTFFTVKNVYGKYVKIDFLDLHEALRNQSFKLFGMDVMSILQMRMQYLLRRGKLPITVERIKEIFGIENKQE